MPLNSQHKRVKKNRVSITFDVETNGSIEKKELPFVIGVIGDFCGTKSDSEKEKVHLRQFVEINKDNFDDVMSSISPQLDIKVDNALEKSDEENDSQMAVELKFNKMSDFKPINIVNQVEPLKKLLSIRTQLKELLSKADRSHDLEVILKDVLQNTESLESLHSELSKGNGEQ